MSDYTVVSGVSRVLRRILWEGFSADPVIRGFVTSESDIVFANPTETVRDSSNRLSLWLYQVTENEFVKNQPMQRVARERPEEEQFPPLALNFSYLLTPVGPSGEADHLILGKTMRILYDNATVLVREAGDSLFEELRIIFCRLTLEELTRIWEALREPYRLSVCYLVRVTRIDSERRPAGVRVFERYAGVGDAPRELKEGEV